MGKKTRTSSTLRKRERERVKDVDDEEVFCDNGRGGLRGLCQRVLRRRGADDERYRDEHDHERHHGEHDHERTDMANDTIAEEEPASSDDGRRRLLDMHESMNDTMMNMTMNDTMGNMTMNGTDMANDTIAEEEPASSDDGRRRLLDMHESMNDTM